MKVKKFQVLSAWLGHVGLRFMQTLNDTEQQKCRASAELLDMFSEKFKLQHETVLSLQYYMFRREQNKNIVEGMGCLRFKANECG